MVSFAVGCSTLFVITVYISGVESQDANTVRENAKKKETEHDISVFFRPMLGKRGSFYTPRLGKREYEDDDAPYLSWSGGRSDAETREEDTLKDQPLLLEWYNPREGRRASYFVPRLGKRASYFTPRLGRDLDIDSPNSPWQDASDYDTVKQRRGGKEEKVWKAIGIFNPRLGRSVQSDIVYEHVRDHSKNGESFNYGRE